MFISFTAKTMFPSIYMTRTQPKANCILLGKKLFLFFTLFFGENPSKRQKWNFFPREFTITLWNFCQKSDRIESTFTWTNWSFNNANEMALSNAAREKKVHKKKMKLASQQIYSENIEMREITVCVMLTIRRWRWVIMLTRANQRLRL